MKNHSLELPPVTYKEAIKLLNGLCEGLGDAMEENRKAGGSNLAGCKMRLSDMMKTAFFWSASHEGLVNWIEISNVLCEIESGAGIKK